MTREEAISWLGIAVPIKAVTQEEFNKFIEAVNMAIKALEQEPCIQEKQANANKIDVVYIDGFKAGYSQARFDLEQEPILDKIRAEILALDTAADYDYEGYYKAVTDAVQIIDKYRQEPKPVHWRLDTTDPDFRRRWYCPHCGNWQGYGEPPYCPWCGKRVLKEGEA